MAEKKLFEGKFPAVAVPTGGEDGVKLIRFGKASTGSHQCLMYFKIISGDYAGETVPWFGYLTKDAYDRTMQSWRYCGWKGSDIENPGPMNQQVEIEVSINEYDGKRSTRVDFVNPAGGGSMKLKDPVVGAALAELVKRLRAAASKVGEVDGPTVDRASIRAASSSEPHVERDPVDPHGDPPPPNDFDAPPARGRSGGGSGWDNGPSRSPAGGVDDDIPF